jgi:hypothetical protein
MKGLPWRVQNATCVRSDIGRTTASGKGTGCSHLAAGPGVMYPAGATSQPVMLLATWQALVTVHCVHCVHCGQFSCMQLKHQLVSTWYPKPSMIPNFFGEDSAHNRWIMQSLHGMRKMGGQFLARINSFDVTVVCATHCLACCRCLCWLPPLTPGWGA